MNEFLRCAIMKRSTLKNKANKTEHPLDITTSAKSVVYKPKYSVFDFHIYSLLKLGYNRLKATGFVTWVYIHQKIT